MVGRFDFIEMLLLFVRVFIFYNIIIFLVYVRNYSHRRIEISFPHKKLCEKQTVSIIDVVKKYTYKENEVHPDSGPIVQKFDLIRAKVAQLNEK